MANSIQHENKINRYADITTAIILNAAILNFITFYQQFIAT